MVFTRRRILAATFGTIIGVPVLVVAGTAGYIKYRAMTKPPEHEFRDLVDENGKLLLDNFTVDPPTRWETFVRVCTLVRLFLPAFVLYWLMKWRDDWYLTWLNYLLACVERAGPAFVKAGQWACTRNDLFSPVFRGVFQQLYMEASIHPFAKSKEILEADFGKPIGELFAEIKPQPIGSGSIGQVHDATLKDGQRVAVKVMHPMVVETIAKDFFVIHWCARFADYWFPSLKYFRLQLLAKAWTNHLAAQLDFRIEGEHLQLFHDNFKDLPYAKFPKYIDSSQRCLIMSFEPGEPATKEMINTLPQHVRDRLAAQGLNTYCKMLLRDNFIHGDLHPGNILMDGRDPNFPQSTLIDVGLCQKLTQRESKTVHDLMASFVYWDDKLLADTILSMSDDQSYADEKKFRQDTTDLMKHFRPITGDEEEIITNILQSMFEVVRLNRISMDPGFVSMLFSVLVLESLIMNLNEEYNMVRHCAPWLIGDGHLSYGLVKKTFWSNIDGISLRLHSYRAKFFGTATDEPYVPTRRPRFEGREHSLA